MAGPIRDGVGADGVDAIAPRRLLIFDCDGVLVDSERLHVDIDVRCITELGWPITHEEVIERHLGRSERDAIADIASVIGAPVPDAWVQRWRAAYTTAYETELAAVPGVADALRDLTAAGWVVCVATSGHRDLTWRKLRRCGLDGWFSDESVFTAAEVAHGKPAPDLFLLAASRMGFAPSECVVVEDSRPGVAAARAAGMPCIGFAGGVTRAADLAAADVVVTEADGLRDLAALAAGLLPAPGS